MHVGGAWVGRRGRILIRGVAPQNGYTPLHAAAMGVHLEVARVLLDAGADITAEDNVSQRRVGGEG